MPKIPIDYNNTLIYKLRHKEDYDNANIYVGHTINFTKRKHNHKSCCTNEKNEGYDMKKYQYIRNNGGWDEWNMIEIEKHPCNDKREAEAREEYWREHFNSTLNSKKCYTSDKDKKFNGKAQCKKYREDNIEHIKAYNQKNADKRKVYQKQYRERKKDEKLT